MHSCRHAQLCQEDHAPELDDGTVTRTVFIHDDLGHATTVVPASTAMTNNSEHTQALNSCGPNVTGIGLAMIACVGLTTVITAAYPCCYVFVVKPCEHRWSCPHQCVLVGNQASNTA